MSLSLLIFLVGYSFLLLRAFISRPIFGLYAYIFAFYAHPISRWWGYSLPEVRWSLIAALVTLLAIFIKTNKKDLIWFQFKETKLFLFFTLFVIAQSLWALNTDIHMIYVMLVIKFSILIFLIQNSIKNSKDAVGFIVANLIGCAYFGYLAILRYTFNINLPWFMIMLLSLVSIGLLLSKYHCMAQNDEIETSV